MASRKQMLSSRKKELLEKGYPPGIVNKSLDWAVGCAEGMAGYVAKLPGNDNDEGDLEKFTIQFLPQYLVDAEKWIRGFGHEPNPK